MILVAGATGQLGGLIARQLLAQGRDVRVLVREGSSHGGLVDSGADIAVGDLRDPESLARACAGVEAVITTANSIGRVGDGTIDSVDRLGNFNLIDAATGQEVERFVFVSALGASSDSPMPLLRAKGDAEQHLRASGMAWTVLEPNAYMDTLFPAVVGNPSLAGQPVTIIGEGRRRHSYVAIRDVVAYAVAALDKREARRATLVLGGPQAVSWRDVLAAYERELGHDLPVRYVAIGEAVPGMPDFVREILTALATYDSPIDMNPLAAAYGLQPTSVDDVVHEFVAVAA